MDSGAVQERLEKAGIDIAADSGDNCRLAVEDSVTRTEIDLRERVVRKTWKLLGFAHSRTYALDRPSTVRILEKSRFLEGYRIDSFDVFVSVRGGQVRISSAGHIESARLVRDRIEKFLKGGERGCPGSMTASAGR